MAAALLGGLEPMGDTIQLGKPLAYFVLTLAAPTFVLLVGALMMALASMLTAALLAALGIGAGALSGLSTAVTVGIGAATAGLWTLLRRGWAGAWRWRNAVPLNKLRPEAKDRFGAKAVQLGQLAAMGFPVAQGVGVRWGRHAVVNLWVLLGTWVWLRMHRWTGATQWVVRSSAVTEDGPVLQPGIFPTAVCKPTLRALWKLLWQMHAEMLATEHLEARHYRRRATTRATEEDVESTEHNSSWVVGWFVPAETVATVATGSAELPDDRTTIRIEWRTDDGLDMSSTWDWTCNQWSSHPATTDTPLATLDATAALAEALCKAEDLPEHWVAEVAWTPAPVLLQLRSLPVPLLQRTDETTQLWYRNDGIWPSGRTMSPLLHSCLRAIGWVGLDKPLWVAEGQLFVSSTRSLEALSEPKTPPGLSEHAEQVLQVALPWLRLLRRQIVVGQYAAQEAAKCMQLADALELSRRATVFVGPQEAQWLAQLRTATDDERDRMLANEPVDGTADPATPTYDEIERTQEDSAAQLEAELLRPSERNAMQPTPTGGGWLPWRRWWWLRQRDRAMAAADQRFACRQEVVAAQAELRQKLLQLFGPEVFSTIVVPLGHAEQVHPLDADTSRIVTDARGDIVAAVTDARKSGVMTTVVPGRATGLLIDVRTRDTGENNDRVEHGLVVLLADAATPSLLLMQRNVVAIVSTSSSTIAHLALAATELGVPMISGADATAQKQLVGRVVDVSAEQSKPPTVCAAGEQADG